MSVPSSKIAYTKDIPNIEKPRTSVTWGVPISFETMGYVTWSSTRVGLRPIHSVKTITWGSERSGMASRRVRLMATAEPTRAKPTPNNTSKRLRAQSSMIFSTMGVSSAPGFRDRLLAVVFHRRLPLDGGAQPALGVDEEVARGHDGLSLAD